MARDSRRGSRKSTSWLAIATSTLGQAAGVFETPAIGAVTFPRTVMRIRGELLVGIGGTEAAGDLVLVTCGLIVVNVDTTNVITPFSDAQSPWLWWAGTHVGMEVAGDSSVIRTVRIPVDVKAMRKIAPNAEELRFVVEATTLGGAALIDAALIARALIGV